MELTKTKPNHVIIKYYYFNSNIQIPHESVHHLVESFHYKLISTQLSQPAPDPLTSLPFPFLFRFVSLILISAFLFCFLSLSPQPLYFSRVSSQESSTIFFNFIQVFTDIENEEVLL